MIAGSSMHNQRIERFWRDLFVGCTHYMEEIGLVDANNLLHLWCLHLIYVPYINYSIEKHGPIML